MLHYNIDQQFQNTDQKKRKKKNRKRIPPSARIPLIDTKGKRSRGCRENRATIAPQKGKTPSVFALLPFPRPSFFSPRATSFHSPHPNFTRTSLDFRSICRYTRPLFPLRPPSLIPLYRWTTVTDDLTIANPCRHPLLICSEFLTASPLETVAKKPPSHFIPSPALPIVLLSSSFARTATSSTSSSSSSSLFHLPSTCNLVGTHVTMVVENSKDRPPLGSMLASNLHVSFMANVWRAKENAHIGWISAMMIAMLWFRGEGVDLRVEEKRVE